jgi:hypothetical protein
MLVDGSVDRKIQRKHLVIHGKIEVPIGRLVLQNGRVRDLTLRKNFGEYEEKRGRETEQIKEFFAPCPLISCDGKMVGNG